MKAHVCGDDGQALSGNDVVWLFVSLYQECVEDSSIVSEKSERKFNMDNQSNFT